MTANTRKAVTLIVVWVGVGVAMWAVVFASHEGPAMMEAATAEEIVVSGGEAVVGGFGYPHVKTDAGAKTVTIESTRRPLLFAVAFGIGSFGMCAAVHLLATRGRIGSNWRVAIAPVALVGLGFAYVAAGAAIEVLSRPNARLSTSDLAAYIAVTMWGELRCAEKIDRAQSPRVITYLRAGRRSYYDIVLLWNSEGRVKGIRLVSGLRDHSIALGLAHQIADLGDVPVQNAVSDQ